MQKIIKNIYLILFLLVFFSCSTKKKIEKNEFALQDTIQKEQSKELEKGKKFESLEKRSDKRNNVKIDHAQFLNTIYPFPSEGRSILDIGKGDLNSDGLDDYVILWKMLLEEDCDCNKYGIDGCLTCCPTRQVELLLHRPKIEDTLVTRTDEDFILGDSNEEILYKKCSLPDGEPFNNLEVGNGFILISQSVGGIDKMDRTIKFELNNSSKTLELVLDNIFYFGNPGKSHKDEGERTQKDFGIITFKKFNINPQKEKNYR